MKWILDWKCSLYSLTVCLDSMYPSPCLFYYYFFFHSLLFGHILHQWYFLYLRITGQNKYTSKSIMIPLHLGSLKQRMDTVGVGRGMGWGDKLAFFFFFFSWMIPTVIVVKLLARWDAEQETVKASTWTVLGGGGVQQHCNVFWGGALID